MPTYFDGSGEEINLDFDAEDRLLSIEAMNASQCLPPQVLAKYWEADVEYDARSDIAYIALVDPTPGQAPRRYTTDRFEVGTEIGLDFNGEGQLIGIEVCEASKHLPEPIVRALLAGSERAPNPWEAESRSSGR